MNENAKNTEEAKKELEIIMQCFCKWTKKHGYDYVSACVIDNAVMARTNVDCPNPLDIWVDNKSHNVVLKIKEDEFKFESMYDRIDVSKNLGIRLAKKIGKAKKELEIIMQRFWKWAKKYEYDYASIDVLEETTVVSTGMDYPNSLFFGINNEPQETKVSKGPMLYNDNISNVIIKEKANHVKRQRKFFFLLS